MNYEEILDKLEEGELRSADKTENGWKANVEVKKAILESFKNGENTSYEGIYEGFVDKHNLPPRYFEPEDGVRLVPGGSSVRRGAYVAPGVIIMPPAYVNVGAYVDEGSMVDSHALVGSCAQIGKNVHLSAGVQIGGVLEPVGMNPVIIEDDCFVGAGVVIVEGILVRSKAVIAPGVVLSKSIPVYDAVKEEIRERGSEIPEGAVVIPGSRPVNSDWAKKQGLSMDCPIIVKYRDEGSNASLELEEALR
ncbi:2,3,4,5-tetrahydropyridine-2,6-dicarboxylate N-succinyltransferase [Balneola sp. EhC07]|uniref:2,3,4,5-tetrahydropyridine-2,6-dicarboxylate N-succinyltransferase n=1 Tax=Balneola sp. EhC07 TaxID=1849360 RepID=UPI0007F3A084|nr:2,3,4,5-tetrahydropyridine-2,6-dicarboxylate N-succinyltransferase [Balneola sp. EhC07]OAN64753.1 2,3,4,5-tetrahydropyridine-2,6-dicarboxylate N-succinyltransferase [Balneola sp. EhC07]